MATATPPFAVPSSFVSTIAVDAGHAHELARLRRPVLADRRVQHEQNLLRRPRDLARRNAPDLVQLVHQIHARVKTSGRVDENRIAPLRHA